METKTIDDRTEAEAELQELRETALTAFAQTQATRRRALTVSKLGPSAQDALLPHLADETLPAHVMALLPRRDRKALEQAEKKRRRRRSR